MPSFLKQTSDEVEIQGGEGKSDYRRLNSYPFKVLPVCVGVLRAFLAFLRGLSCFALSVVCSVKPFPASCLARARATTAAPTPTRPRYCLCVCPACVFALFSLFTLFCLFFLVVEAGTRVKILYKEIKTTTCGMEHYMYLDPSGPSGPQLRHMALQSPCTSLYYATHPACSSWFSYAGVGHNPGILNPYMPPQCGMGMWHAQPFAMPGPYSGMEQSRLGCPLPTVLDSGPMVGGVSGLGNTQHQSLSEIIRREVESLRKKLNVANTIVSIKRKQHHSMIIHCYLDILDHTFSKKNGWRGIFSFLAFAKKRDNELSQLSELGNDEAQHYLDLHVIQIVYFLEQVLIFVPDKFKDSYEFDLQYFLEQHPTFDKNTKSLGFEWKRVSSDELPENGQQISNMQKLTTELKSYKSVPFKPSKMKEIFTNKELYAMACGKTFYAINGTDIFKPCDSGIHFDAHERFLDGRVVDVFENGKMSKVARDMLRDAPIMDRAMPAECSPTWNIETLRRLTPEVSGGQNFKKIINDTLEALRLNKPDEDILSEFNQALRRLHVPVDAKLFPDSYLLDVKTLRNPEGQTLDQNLRNKNINIFMGIANSGQSDTYDLTSSPGYPPVSMAMHNRSGKIQDSIFQRPDILRPNAKIAKIRHILNSKGMDYFRNLIEMTLERLRLETSDQEILSGLKTYLEKILHGSVVEQISRECLEQVKKLRIPEETTLDPEIRATNIERFMGRQ